MVTTEHGEVSHRREIGASADQVWELIADFGAIDRYSPMIESCRVEGPDGVGQRRVLRLTNGTITISRLEAIDHRARTLTYRILETKLPLDDYTSTMVVEPRGSAACELIWTSRFLPKGATLEEATRVLDEGLLGSLGDLQATFVSGS